MAWEVFRHIRTMKDTLVGPSVYITKNLRQGFHTGIVVDHHLAEVEAQTGISMLLWKKGSSASNAPDPQFKPHIGSQKCDSGELYHCLRYTGDLPAT